MKQTLILIIVVAVIAGYVLMTKNPSNTNDGTLNGKLDINVVCESALSYMSFQDAADADRFVAECKEGKHPEVIERYKEDMNLGDGKAI